MEFFQHSPLSCGQMFVSVCWIAVGTHQSGVSHLPATGWKSDLPPVSDDLETRAHSVLLQKVAPRVPDQASTCEKLSATHT